MPHQCPPHRLVTCPAGQPPNRHLPCRAQHRGRTHAGACSNKKHHQGTPGVRYLPTKARALPHTYPPRRPVTCPTGLPPYRPAPCPTAPTTKRNTKNHQAPTRKHQEPETHQHRNPPNKHQPNPHPTGRAPPGTTVWEHKTSTGTTHRTKRENTVGGHGAQTQASQTPTGGAQAGHDSYG